MVENDEAIVFGGKFRQGEQIGKGAFGIVFAGINIENAQEVAIKLEVNGKKQSTLRYEAKLYKQMQGGIGVPKFFYYGEEAGYRVLVIELLGPSLEELMKRCGGTFSLPTVLSVGEQMLTRIEHFHNQSYLHRDVKPDNFTIGTGTKNSMIYLIDYGLMKRYRDSKTLIHICFRDNKLLTGTTRFTSIYTHKGIEQARRDDIEALTYSLIYLLKGSLPWQGLPARTKEQKYKKILDLKSTISPEELSKGFPTEFAQLLHYSRGLKFEEKPDYTYIHKLLKDVFYRQEVDSGFEYEWAKPNINLSLIKEKTLSISESNIAEHAANINDSLLCKPGQENSQSLAHSSSAFSLPPEPRIAEKSESFFSHQFRLSQIDCSPSPTKLEDNKLPLIEEDFVRPLCLDLDEDVSADINEDKKLGTAKIEELLCERTNSSNYNFRVEKIIEYPELLEEEIPEEKPLHNHVIIRNSNYINNERHRMKYQLRPHLKIQTIIPSRVPPLLLKGKPKTINCNAKYKE